MIRSGVLPPAMHTSTRIRPCEWHHMSDAWFQEQLERETAGMSAEEREAVRAGMDVFGSVLRLRVDTLRSRGLLRDGDFARCLNAELRGLPIRARFQNEFRAAVARDTNAKGRVLDVGC